MKKKTATLVTAAVLSAICVSTSWAAGWGQDERGYWYQFPTGSYARSGFSTIDGVMYAFDAEGYMITGWQSQDGKWYYFAPEGGAQALGWTQIDGKWYYFDAAKSGAMFTGWKTEGNKTYFFGSDGAMIQGENVIFCTCPPGGFSDGYMYQSTADGSIIKNKVDEENKVIYDEYGRVKMKDALSVASGIATGEQFYQYVMCEHNSQQSVHDQKENIRYAIGEHLERYAEKYDENVRNVKSSKYAARYAEWKEKLLKGLEEYISGTIYESDFADYINEVVNDTFDNADHLVENLPLYYFQ